MGLHLSHNAYSASYRTFNDLRQWIGRQIGLDLSKMEGFSTSNNPIKWEDIEYNPLHELLDHSDCEGKLTVEQLEKIVPELKRIAKGNLPKSEIHAEYIIKMINGFERALINNEPIIFS